MTEKDMMKIMLLLFKKIKKEAVSANNEPLYLLEDELQSIFIPNDIYDEICKILDKDYIDFMGIS